MRLPFSRVGATVRNVLEVARFGGLETGEEPAPFEVAAEVGVCRLRRYFPAGSDREAPGVPVVLVPPLMLTAEVFDVSPQASAVTTLHESGIDPWVVDFGVPEREPGGLQRTLSDHVLTISDAIDVVRETTGRDVHIGGYSQGGMFCYQVAAYRRSDGVASITTFGSPVDVRGGNLLGIPGDVSAQAAPWIVDNVLRRHAVPGWATRSGFNLLDPIGSARSRAQFLLALHDRDSLLPREGQRRYLMEDGWIAWPGPALAEFVREFMAANRMVVGGFTLGDRLVSLADIDVPILTFVGEVDEIAPPDSVRAIRRAAPRPSIFEVSLRAGHFGLVVGRTAQRVSWPVVAAFARWCEGVEGELPDAARPVDAGDPAEPEGDGVSLAVDAGSGATRALAGAVSSVRSVAAQATTQLPRLARLAGARGRDRVSLSLLFAEQARRRPDVEGFLWEDRAFTFGEVDERIDGIVRGLLREGVRPGEPVGVMMSTRPTALAVVAAVNRIGAIAVMLRPGADTAQEIKLAQVTRIVADPEHADLPAGRRPVHVFLLDSPSLTREADLTALELPPDSDFEPPAWYRRDAGRADDVAFVLFSGPADQPRARRITNGRCAVAAFATAATGSLSDHDTVYSVGALHHPAGLLTSVAGAVAGGSRLAMARALDPATFWEEARRYGVTVVSYTWAQLGDLLTAPRDPAERGHSVRLFAGSGMPSSLWRAANERFAPARVVEFWAATEGEAVLANVKGTKIGSVGRPIPGAADIALARWDHEKRCPVTGPDGFVERCAPGEPGLLLSREATWKAGPLPLRDVFEAGDAWTSSETLFARDADGDYWLQAALSDVIDVATGPVAPEAVVTALGAIPGVHLAVVYEPDQADASLVAAAVQLRAGATLTAAALDEAFAVLPASGRPAVVRVVAAIETTGWHRPIAGSLAGKSIPVSTKARPVFIAEPGEERYRPLTRARRARLMPTEPPVAHVKEKA